MERVKAGLFPGSRMLGPSVSVAFAGMKTKRPPVPEEAGAALKVLERISKKRNRKHQSEHQNRLIARDEGPAQRLDCSITALLLTAQNN